MPNYRLYIDETGDFDDETDTVAVVGLLVRADFAVADPAPLRAAIERIAPEIPWPVHAAHANYPIMWVFWSTSANSTADWAVAAAELAGVLRLAAAENFAFVEADIAKRRRPKLERVQALHRTALLAAGDLYSVLKRRAADVREQLRALPRQLVALGADKIDSLVATEGQIGISKSPDLKQDRYLALLAILLNRAVDVVARPPQPNAPRGIVHQIWVGALNRGIFEASIGRKMLLNSSHIAHACKLATNNPQRARQRGETTVRLIQWETPAFQGDVAAGYLLADQAAYDSRQILQHTGDPHLETLTWRLRNATGWRFASGNPALAHLAASGVAYVFVEEHRNNVKLPVPPVASQELSEQRRWIQEQAMQWATEVQR